MAIDVMNDLDALLRGVAAGSIALVAGAFHRSLRGTTLGWISLMFAASAVGYVLRGHSAVLDWRPLAQLIVGMLTLSAPFFYWAFARLLFDDEFQLRPIHWAILVLILVTGVGQAVAPGIRFHWLPTVLRLTFQLVSLALVCHIFWIVWSGRPFDLVEKRARFRLRFLVLTGVVVAFVLLAALLYETAPHRPLPARLTEAAALAALALGFAITVIRHDPDFFPPDGPPDHTMGSPIELNAADVLGNTDPEADLLRRLDTAMRQQQAWRETGLTINGLAARAAIPEYRLRRLINQRLGFRNFTAFINDYRLSAAAARLADPNQARIPVLTIALELGWGSIGPFNRSFRTRFGMTPTDYRRQQQSGIASGA